MPRSMTDKILRADGGEFSDGGFNDHSMETAVMELDGVQPGPGRARWHPLLALMIG
jgi:hypothetical protein